MELGRGRNSAQGVKTVRGPDRIVGDNGQFSGWNGLEGAGHVGYRARHDVFNNLGFFEGRMFRSLRHEVHGD